MSHNEPWLNISNLHGLEVPPICRPQLQTANCWYYRPNYVYNHLLDRCDWSGWSACNSKLNSFRTRADCERICLGNRKRSGNQLQQFDDFLSPNFIKEIPLRKGYLSYQRHQNY
nr:hypothetical transcript [Hymenolepis microstoma]